jgi:zinc transport system permease protein
MKKATSQFYLPCLNFALFKNTYLELLTKNKKTQVLEIFLIKPFIAIILIAIACSALGVFVLWKKLSYFGDALSHAILLGLGLGVVFEINQILTLVIFAIIFAIMVASLSRNRFFSKDIIIMISSYFCVALAIILNDVWIKDFNFSSYIFGDVLAVSSQELYALAAITLAAIFYIIFAFKKILLIKINKDLAQIENIKTELWNLSFLILLALVIALSVRIVGVFLMTALLILPAAIARIFSTSAKQMMMLSVIFGIVVSAFSFKVATTYDITVGSTIIAIFSLIFIASSVIEKFISR